MKIKLLPGLLSCFHIFEFFMYCIIGAMCLVPNIYLIGIIVAIVLCFCICRCVFLIFSNGCELFMKVKNHKLFVFRDLFFYKSCLLNEKTIVYKTKVIGIEHGFRIAKVRPGKPTVEKDGLLRVDAFVILTNQDLINSVLKYEYDEKSRLICCKENFLVTYNLIKNKEIILLSGSKRNYSFLRKQVTKSQFIGITETDKKDIEKLEQNLKKTNN